jgi:hypothetical protein
LEIPVSRGGFGGKYAGFQAERQAGWEGSGTLFPQDAEGGTHAPPRVINVDKNAAYPKAVETLKKEKTLPKAVELGQNTYLNNVIEQDHRNIKRVVKPMMGFKSFNSARKTLRGIEAMNMIRKGQVNGIDKGDSVSQAKLVEELFGIIA